MTAVFEEAVFTAQGAALSKSRIDILQVNLGKFCNLACVHCHVEAGPGKTRENMDRATAGAVLRFLVDSGISTLDLTGGAPELNPNFRFLVHEARQRNVHVIDRCNLTVLFEKGQEDLADFLRAHRVEVIASLPCYSRENVDLQRGQGTFDESIRALQNLNGLGYGREGTGLILNLVYNPVGPHLPPPQERLEQEYKEILAEDFGIVFNRLYTITNMPITRYAKYLRVQGRLEKYEQLLAESFNAATLAGLMCRNTLSVGWDGVLYDCDFNQAMDLPMGNGQTLTVFNSHGRDFSGMEIRTGPHCFGCTAGSGSSCQGALTMKEAVVP